MRPRSYVLDYGTKFLSELEIRMRECHSCQYGEGHIEKYLIDKL